MVANDEGIFMTALDFTITFHGPFHVARGAALSGFDRTVDRDALLPASSLKGVMRAEAIGRLRIRAGVVDAIFGAPGRPAAWAWSDAIVVGAEIGRLARIRVVSGSGGQVDDHFLMLGEHVWADSGHFTVSSIAPLDAATEAQHVVVLRTCSQSLVSLGGARNRGEGWVTVSDGHPLTPEEIGTLRDLQEVSG